MFKWWCACREQVLQKKMSTKCCGRNVNGQPCSNDIAKKKSNLTQQVVYDHCKNIFCSAHLLKIGRDFGTFGIEENTWKSFTTDQFIEFQHKPARDVVAKQDPVPVVVEESSLDVQIEQIMKLLYAIGDVPFLNVVRNGIADLRARHEEPINTDDTM